MLFKLLTIKSLFSIVYANIENELVIDFFLHKRISSFVGYSCSFLTDDLLLIKDLNKKGITASIQKLNNETRVQLLAKPSYRRLGILVDIRCFNSKNVASLFGTATEYRMFNELYNWLIFGPDLSSILQVINDEAFGIATDLTVAYLSRNDTYEFYDAYNLFKERGTLLNVTYFGQYNRKTGLSINLTQDKLARRCNFNQLPLIAMFWKCVYKPEHMRLDEYYEDYEHATKDGQSKFGFHILGHLADIYNFTLRARESAKWGKNDSLGPMIRALMNNKADFTGTPISMSIQRTYLFKYVHMDWPFRTCFMFRNPQPKNIKVEEIFRPLSNQTWFLMGLVVVVNITILSMVFSHEGVDNNIMKFSNSLLINIGALCQQGTDIATNRMSTRIAYMFILIFNLLIYNYYSASVVSARLDEPVYKINDSIIEMSKLQLKIASEWAVYMEPFLKRPDRDLRYFYENFWSKLPEEKKYTPPEIGMRLVKKGGFAYHTHPEVAYQNVEKFFDNSEICEIMEVHTFGPLLTTFGIRLNSTFPEMARVGLTKISEVGLRKRQVMRWQYRKPKCDRSILTATSINMYEFASHLILLTIGMIVSVILCLAERIIVKKNVYTDVEFNLWNKISLRRRV